MMLAARGGPACGKGSDQKRPSFLLSGLFFLPFRLLICWLQAAWCRQDHLAWAIDTTFHLAVQPRLMEKERVSLSLVLLPSHREGWGPWHKTYLRTKKHRITSDRIWWNERRKQQNHIFTAMKFCLVVILTFFYCLNTFTEKFYSRWCSGSILGLQRQEWGGWK